ncbi:pectate lyase domain-containing protein [Ditylenchus destructor]|nr:pectate lyase domain-containing protein [Ditylenchus destructor]
MFELEDGATIQNLVLGKPVADEIHCLGSCTIENCCADDTYKVVGGGAKNAPNKVFQQDGGGTATIENFQFRVTKAARGIASFMLHCPETWWQPFPINNINKQS